LNLQSYPISFLLALFRNFAGTIFFFSDFNVCRDFSDSISFLISYFDNFTALFCFILQMEQLYLIFFRVKNKKVYIDTPSLMITLKGDGRSGGESGKGRKE
jgi:hypothetical protein